MATTKKKVATPKKKAVVASKKVNTAKKKEVKVNNKALRIGLLSGTIVLLAAILIGVMVMATMNGGTKEMSCSYAGENIMTVTYRDNKITGISSSQDGLLEDVDLEEANEALEEYDGTIEEYMKEIASYFVAFGATCVVDGQEIVAE